MGTAGHHYLFTGANYGISARTDAWFYHSRVLGRYEDEHLQMSGLLLKYRISPRFAIGGLIQRGNQRGEEVFAAMRIPLGSDRDEEEGKRRSRLDLHLGAMWAQWRGEWEGTEWSPYVGLSWQPANDWLLTAEIRERQKDFLKPAWMIAVHRTFGNRWQLTIGFHQSGLSDRPYLFIGLGSGFGGVLR